MIDQRTPPRGWRRRTRETTVEVALRRPDSGKLGAPTVSIGRPFYDHMFATLLAYAGFEGSVTARGDLPHHIIEDTAITLGLAVRDLVPEHCARFADHTLPMDDALVLVALDVGSRAYFAGTLPSRLATHALRSFSEALGATLHVRVLAGIDRHHIIEAAFKATGLAVRDALRDSGATFSTKGKVEIERIEVGP